MTNGLPRRIIVGAIPCGRPGTGVSRSGECLQGAIPRGRPGAAHLLAKT